MKTLNLLCVAAVVGCLGAIQPSVVLAGKATERAKALGIPSLDDMAGDWMPMSGVTYPPSLHNGHNMLIVDRDLTSYFFSPGGWLFNLAAYADAKEPGVWRRGYPTVKLLIDGVEYPAWECRQGSYRALRRNPHCNGLSVETDTRLVDEERGVLTRITFTNPTFLPRQFQVTLSMPGSVQPDGVGVANTFQRPGVISVIRPSRRPDQVEIDAYIVAAWKWNLQLAPGESCSLGFAAGDEAVPMAGAEGFIQGDIGNEKGRRTDARVAEWVEHFEAVFEQCKEARENRWADAFTAGNRHFSGHVPTLKTADAALARNYYMGVYTFLCLERTQFPLHPRCFITNGERDDGTQFYNDLALTAPLWILLEPDGAKAVLRRWLVQNPRSGAWLDLRQVKGYDARRLDRLYGYGFNACLIFRSTDSYLRMTGDMAFLDEKLENGQTVWDRMEALATDWETLPRGPGGLVDYGGNECLLECNPAYVHCVASMNAQIVWGMRRMAEWHEWRGDAARAGAMRTKAATMLPVVMGLYKAGEGVWYAGQPNGDKHEIRHCMDYVFAGDALCGDLTGAQKAEMNAFVKKELFTRDWMRAMSLRDPAANVTRRADHGPTGSYDGWIPTTVGAMWRLGDPTSAYEFYRRTASVTREGSFTQAHEFYGPTWNMPDAPVRITTDRGNLRESCASAGFASVVVDTFFGFAPDLTGTRPVNDPGCPRPFEGELKHVLFRGKDIQLNAGSSGVTVLCLEK